MTLLGAKAGGGVFVPVVLLGFLKSLNGLNIDRFCGSVAGGSGHINELPATESNS